MKLNTWMPLVTLSTRQPKSVLTPLLWLNAILLCAVILSIRGSSELLTVWFMSLATVTILFTLGAYAYFAQKEPHRLQSEGHVEQMAGISMMGRDGNSLAITSLPSSNPSSNDASQIRAAQDNTDV